MKRCRGPRVFVIVNSVYAMYPDDFNSTQLKDLGLELSIYIDNVRADERFAILDTIFEHAKLMVRTKNDLAFSLVYRLLKLILVLPVAMHWLRDAFQQ